MRLCHMLSLPLNRRFDFCYNAGMNWAYVAGFFDGEGHLGFRRMAKVIKLEPLAGFSQADKRGGLAALTQIHAFLNSHGVRCSLQRTKRKDNPPRNDGGVRTNYDLWRVHISCRANVATLLHGIRPYSIIRKQDIEDFLRFLIAFPRLPRGGDRRSQKFRRRFGGLRPYKTHMVEAGRAG